MTDLFTTPDVEGSLTYAKPKSPGTVRVAVWFLYAIAALFLVGLALTIWDLATWGTYVDRVAASVQATSAEVATEKSDNVAGDVLAIVVIVLFTAIFIASAVLSRLGKRVGQVMALVAVVPLLFCGLGGLIPESTSRLEEAAANQTPRVLTAIDEASSLVLVPLGIAVFILLLTPSARAFFRGTPPAPPGYMYVPASPWHAGPYAGGAPQWVIPTYGPVPHQGQPGVPPTYPVPPGYPLPPGYPPPGDPAGAVDQSVPSAAPESTGPTSDSGAFVSPTVESDSPTVESPNDASTE